ncbi:MAG: FeoB-associated Cys-rich membrane protein [Peptococcaceae bacterium]|nr:FeoB-associated Cys-rich membrane protein [Peptococcaceae bacterium]MBQ3205041.1 FeoB-associated Cys-rich membrane protein [Peptococcaceae bacterium]MBR2009369.1 FeoB-associated Cys-rich membrane protein [Peptococcaceae bacterium]
MGTLAVSLVLAAMFALAVRSIYKQKKSGGCGCGCSGCPSASTGCGGSCAGSCSTMSQMNEKNYQ